ncbi:hypothetical protein NOM01_10265 [Sporolactobacillus sp. STSJ-5]|uniref:hypothetical protein n=1 Tax=Sporolactobacillus sp. STSJ-5 TaxID=2965076 RepID=UPI002103AB7F|nr:hypothetical protein [Sporolactobacillus sp. STSJ-5]MCQ2010397.1 hypothetical protein [Sporolactobacillus sp. STSJ-5]
MLSDFERKLRQIILNDSIGGRKVDMDALEQRTGHSRQEIEDTIEKLLRLPNDKGGINL